MGELQGCSQIAVGTELHDPDACGIQQGVDQVTNSQAGRESVERYPGRLFSPIPKGEVAVRFLLFAVAK